MTKTGSSKGYVRDCRYYTHPDARCVPKGKVVRTINVRTEQGATVDLYTQNDATTGEPTYDENFDVLLAVNGSQCFPSAYIPDGHCVRFIKTRNNNKTMGAKRVIKKNKRNTDRMRTATRKAVNAASPEPCEGDLPEPCKVDPPEPCEGNPPEPAAGDYPDGLTSHRRT
jgi:hypothetical protein